MTLKDQRPKDPVGRLLWAVWLRDSAACVWLIFKDPKVEKSGKSAKSQRTERILWKCQDSDRKSLRQHRTNAKICKTKRCHQNLQSSQHRYRSWYAKKYMRIQDCILYTVKKFNISHKKYTDYMQLKPSFKNQKAGLTFRTWLTVRNINNFLFSFSVLCIPQSMNDHLRGTPRALVNSKQKCSAMTANEKTKTPGPQLPTRPKRTANRNTQMPMGYTGLTVGQNEWTGPKGK